MTGERRERHVDSHPRARCKRRRGRGRKGEFVFDIVAAAKRATELGLEAYNILEGFEGDPDAQAHRGNKGGWRMRGLPWRQG